MSRLVVSVLALSILVACGGSSSPVVGTWVYDWRASMSPQDLAALDSLPAEERAAREKSAAVEMEFRNDGTGHAQGEFKWTEKDGVVTIEGANNHRADLHLRDGSLYVKFPGRDAESVFRRK